MENIIQRNLPHDWHFIIANGNAATVPSTIRTHLKKMKSQLPKPRRSHRLSNSKPIVIVFYFSNIH
jgi:hypothetical protein